MTALRHFFGQVAGESHHNADGTSRQAIIPRCRVGELLRLEHEPDNPYDINAIRVLRQTGEQIGYLPRDFAAEVVSRSAKGWSYHAVLSGFGRARGYGPYGASLLIIVSGESVVDEEIAQYAERVLAERKPREAVIAPVPDREPIYASAGLVMLGVFGLGLLLGWLLFFR